MNAQIQAREVNLGNSWHFQASTQTEVLPHDGVEQMLAALNVWCRVFPKEATLVQFEYGVPSLFVRFDCVYSSERGLEIFEIEDKPCGMHACATINPDFERKRDALRREWPAFGWVKGERRESDDEGWLGPCLSFEEAIRSRNPILVRCMPTASEFHELTNRSVSTLVTEGDKRYGEAMNLWSVVRPNGDGALHPQLPDVPFVLKPQQGTRCRDVSICLNGKVEVRNLPGRGEVSFLGGHELIKSARDLMSRTQVEKKIRLWGSGVCQRYIQPLSRAHVPGRNVIYRFYFGFSPSQSGWVPLGGVWLASTALRVHGEVGVISGPLEFE